MVPEEAGEQNNPEDRRSNETASEVPQSSEAQTRRYFVPFFQTGYSKDEFGNIDRLVLHYVQTKLDRVVTSTPEETEIDVWVDSPGGSASIAYKLFLNFQHRCRKLRFVIPDYAKSAATLLALGADELFMNPAAELGPLDAQIEHPDREGVQVSALEVARVFDFLGRFATDYVISGGAQVLHWTSLPRADVLREFLKFTASFLQPAVAKLDPHLIYRAKNELDLAKHYAIRILRSRRVPQDEFDEFDEADFAEHIVGHYPVHEFVITRKEAEEFGLKVKNAEEYDKWPIVYGTYCKFRLSILMDEHPQSIVNVWNEEELERRVSENGQENSNNSSESGRS